MGGKQQSFIVSSYSKLVSRGKSICITLQNAHVQACGFNGVSTDGVIGWTFTDIKTLCFLADNEKECRLQLTCP